MSGRRSAKRVRGLLVLLFTLTSTLAHAKLNPCMTPDPGWGVYDKWSRNITMGQVLIPQTGGITRSGAFDLIVHFHGHYPVRKEFVKTAKGIVLAAIDLGVGSGAYYEAFANPRTFDKLVASIEREVALKTGKPRARVRKLGLSSWSAGYGAVSQILKHRKRRVDALILLDSVHAGYANAAQHTLRTEQIKPFLDFARQAARGRRFMFQSHSSIIPPGYAPTREVTHYIVKKLGGKMRKSRRDDVLGLKLFERYDKSRYHARGYRGDDKPDHCAHLGLMADVIRVHINPRWKSPRGRKGKRQLKEAVAKARLEGATYRVRRGDTVSEIAARHGISSKRLRELNGLRKGKPIRVGQELIVPDGKRSTKAKKPDRASPKAAAPPTKPGPGEKRHRVYKGQSLRAIGKRYHVSVDAIRDRNGLKKGGRRIQPGDVLIIPKP